MKKPVPTTKKNQTQPFSKTRFLFLVIGILIGIASGYLTTYFLKSRPQPLNLKETRAGGYKFINPLLDCDNFHTADNSKMASLKKELSNYANDALTKKSIDHISIYYRDLNNGPWLGINEHDNYSPANVSKVPLLITVLKKAESDTGFLKKKIPFSPFVDKSDNSYTKIPKTKTLTSIDQLLNFMLINKDNGARDVLEKLVGSNYFAKIVHEMGIVPDTENPGSELISVKDYSSFFRILYNASFLSREMSEKALEILSKSDSKQGIPARLPSDIIVSHKYGERMLTGSSKIQLHDCGIIYYSNTPYLLCIMTKGDNIDNLDKVIADVSEIVYQNIK